MLQRKNCGQQCCNEKIADIAVTSAKIANNAVTQAAISTISGPASGQFLQWNVRT